MDLNLENLDYNSYVEIADGVYWVGFADESIMMHCNPYLIVDGGEAVLIDGGSRNEFSTVMLKIMRTGTNPGNIHYLIYSHFDPDLCGNLPHLEMMIGGGDLRVLSHKFNNHFINYYSTRTPKLCVEDMGFRFSFASGRQLRFIMIPYSHAPGSFVTYDEKTKTLFSSDLFGSYDADWRLFTRIQAYCASCDPTRVCPETGKICELKSLLAFHKRVMTSTKALRHTLKQLENLDIALIAPQHGSVYNTKESCGIIMERLKLLTGVGIDGLVEGDGGI